MQEKLDKIDKLKAEIDSIRPLKPEEAKQLKEYFRIGLTYSSNALEGNTLTETETKVLLEDGLTAGGKPIKEHLEAVGHSDAFDYIYTILNKDIIDEGDILKLHKLFYCRIDNKNAGVYRDCRVFITGTDFIPPPPQKVKDEMINFVKNLHTSQHPVVSASLAHKNFVTIHPFVDGNGRTARLLMNLLLLKEGYPIVIIPPIRRVDYINSLQKSNKGNDTDFISLIADMTIESLKDYLRMFQK